MGFFDKLKKAFSGSIKLDEDFFEAMEETLILGDLGVSVATDAVEQLRTAIKKEHLQTEEEVKDALRRILTEMLRVGDTALDLSTRPSVVMMIGVNGVGKTTTIGKLGYRLRSEGKKVLFCASDTFRAAAADQLEIWSQRAGVDIVRQSEGSDPGAVLFDAMQAAKARHNDAALGKLAGQRFADRHRGIARAGDAHGLVDVGTARQGIADGAADAGGRAAERFDLRGVVVGFVFKHQQPVLLLAVNGGADAHGAGVDFLALVKHGQLAALFQHFGAQRGQVH